MESLSGNRFSRRERQIMEILFRLGEATAGALREQLPDPPSYSAVRALLRTLEEKGHLAHRREGARYVYRPTVSPSEARRSALNNLLKTFFSGSTRKAVSALLDVADTDLSEKERARLRQWIDSARKEGR